MRSFEHDGPPRVVFGSGSEARVAALLGEVGAQRVLLVANARFRAGADRIHAALGDRSVGIWDGARPQVPREVADALVAGVRETGADWVVAHGGGTAIGAAKAAALETDVRVAAVPTTYSGSEMTSIWGITTDGVKTTGRDERVRPALVVFDPDLYAPLPVGVARTSLYNALAHSIDALFDPDASDTLHDDAEESIGFLVGALQSANDDARADAVYGAYLAGKALGTAKMALHHKLSHVIGGSFGVAHATTHATLLPYTLAFNQMSSVDALRRLRRAFGVRDPGAALFDLSKQLGLPTRLRDAGFDRDAIPRAVALALSAEYPNPRALNGDNLTALLEAAVHGRRPSLAVRRESLSGVSGVHGGIPASWTGPRAHRARGVVLAIHGRGSDADAFIERLRGALDPEVAAVAPQAAHNTWYPKGYRNQSGDNLEALSSALSALDSAFAEAEAAVGADHVAVVGFSQGACLALTWLSSRKGRSRPRSLAAWSGAVAPGYEDFGDLSGVEVYLGIARRDQWVKLAHTDETAAALRGAGADVSYDIADTDEHSIRPADLEGFARNLEITMNHDDLAYQHGFGNALASEARPGALPKLQNGPRQTPFGLYAEQLNGTGFTLRRHLNHRVWMYRLRPQISETGWTQRDSGRFVGRFEEGAVSPEILRFAPMPFPEGEVDFLDGLQTFAGAGDPTTRTGFAIHVYAATADMVDRAFTDIDGDLLIVPEHGRLRIQTELGWLAVRPGEIAILPRGIRFRVEVPDGRARGFVGELFNGHYQLPERGPIGANGLADERHFKAPVAAFEDREVPYEVVHKQGGDLWATRLRASPFDVVAWHGSYAPFKYDLMEFNAYWGANWDHPDPSILTVLTAPHDDHGRNAVDFAVFKGRWDTVEHSFRPPFFHRNSAIEFNAVVKTQATSGPYSSGASTYTPYLSPHGVSVETYDRETGRTGEAADQPVRIPDEEMWIQFESTYNLRVMPWFTNAAHRDPVYLQQFSGFKSAKVD